MAFLSFRDVAYRRDGRTVLDNVSFDIDEAETLVLLGKSGSGKTTVIRLINKSLNFDAGEIRLKGCDLRGIDTIKLRRRIGYVIQEIGLLPHWAVKKNIAMVPVLEGWPREKIDSRVRELMSQVSLPYEQYADRLPHQLSGGQRQRVGVARALASRPDLLLFDEPFGALDPVTRRDMQSQFIRLRDQYRVPAIFVTHDVAEALRLGTRIAVLDEGRLELIATRKDFLQAQSPVARSFLDTLVSREDLTRDDLTRDDLTAEDRS